MKTLFSLMTTVVLAIACYVGYLSLTAEPPPQRKPAERSTSAPPAAQYAISTDASCSYGTGKPRTCKVTLTSESSSTGDFDWTVRGEPDVASADPQSGSLAPDSSSVLTVRMPCTPHGGDPRVRRHHALLLPPAHDRPGTQVLIAAGCAETPDLLHATDLLRPYEHHAKGSP
ncbi:hypothetical protein SAMN05192558_10784 [Actinokineospora alba]|uniref:Uncharacterized protein n=1 Tax=Actinokineospora alba TaxID=504798 RepID=A0A1H0QPG8_9PSEU|nr:hypothetical protein C8E96_6067 [Actinokineospora alba]SDI31195.1 hypothetical protein SAMN05421871_10483 [Actinokineospora alba]SDP19152.1 hypothetical protein SAMN05192558_10784 [Actinokineospora alba]